MKKTIYHLAIITILSLALFGCRKNDTVSNPEDQFENLKFVKQSQIQLFEINGATGGIITGKRGTKITFPPNSFADASNTVFGGAILVQLRESLSKSEWMMDGMSTTTQSEPIISGGMINIIASRKDNGAVLKPAPAMAVPNANLNLVIKAEVPKNAGAANLDMNLFLPDNNASGAPADSTKAPLAWTNANYFPFGNSPNSYIFQLPKFNWTNCDRIAGLPGIKTTVKVTPNMTGFGGATNLQAMFVFKTINMVITLPPQPTFFESYANSIPIGSQADVVLIGKAADGKILFKVLPATTFTASMNISITPDKVPAATVTAYLNSIN
jgi:hypothetical protein